jgi:hypothetical protein
MGMGSSEAHVPVAWAHQTLVLRPLFLGHNWYQRHYYTLQLAWQHTTWPAVAQYKAIAQSEATINELRASRPFLFPSSTYRDMHTTPSILVA